MRRIFISDSTDDCISRFRFLRGEYSRLKRALDTKSGMEAARKKLNAETFVYRQMSFLDCFIVSRKYVPCLLITAIAFICVYYGGLYKCLWTFYEL